VSYLSKRAASCTRIGKENSIEVALKLQIMKFFMQTIENAIFGEFNGKPIAVIYEILSHLFKLVLYIPYKK